jgi:hypothetical protein
MERALKSLPLLGLAAAGHFLGEFLSGAGVFPQTGWFLVSAFCFVFYLLLFLFFLHVD